LDKEGWIRIVYMYCTYLEVYKAEDRFFGVVYMYNTLVYVDKEEQKYVNKYAVDV
jgi:hypothetical protein